MASSSISFLLYHIIFSVKQRQYWIMEDCEPRVHAYIAGIIQHIGGKPIIVGGQRDHIHILSLLPRHVSLSEVMKLIKGKSAHWYNQELEGVRPKLIWQEGYDAISVSPDNLEKVKNYILHQAMHHSNMPFAAEREMMASRLVVSGASTEKSEEPEGSD